MTRKPRPQVIDLDLPTVIDLSDVPEVSLVEVACSPAVRRAATRAVRDLEANHGHGPWIVVCPDTRELIAASPTFDEESTGWSWPIGDGATWIHDDVPLAVVSLGADVAFAHDEPVSRAAQLVAHALSEIVLAERRAALANERAGRAEAMATTDALTGVGNQRAWWSRVTEEEAHRARTSRPSVIAVIDLDDLKEMNDRRGHLHGDLLLRLAAHTLRRTVRPFDVVARVGGDEFAVLAVDYDGDAQTFGERLGRALEGADIHASIGVAMPDATMTLTDTFAAADEAMYAHKRRRQTERTGA